MDSSISSKLCVASCLVGDEEFHILGIIHEALKLTRDSFEQHPIDTM